MKNKIWGIVAASGIGTRMNTAQPKQYLPLHGWRVVDYALRALCECDFVAGVVVGIRADDRCWAAQPFAHAKLLGASLGGLERAHTVLNALEQLMDTHNAAADDWVMVHDGVRPCVRHTDIERLVAAARAHGDGAVLAVRLTDALKQGNRAGLIERTVEKKNGETTDVAGVNNAAGAWYWRALTPQMFRCAALRVALQQSLAQGIVPADESAAMERNGVQPIAVEGHPANLKITVPADLELAEMYLRAVSAE